MAGFEVYHTQSDFDDLFNLDFGDIAEEALKNAAPVLEASMKAAVQASVEHEGDSELVKSITQSGVCHCASSARRVSRSRSS